MVLKCGWNKNTPLVTQCCDKIAVRKYVKKCGFEDTLINLYGIFKNISELKNAWSELPNSFVLKINVGCGYNIIVKNKAEENLGEICGKLSGWSKLLYGFESAETQTVKIKPRIICEKYIGNEARLPFDYKFHFINGELVGILLVSERETGKSKLTLVDGNFNRLNYLRNQSEIESWYHFECTNENYDYSWAKPANMTRLIEVAKKLACPFPFVRVDLYEYEEKPYFGELTFTPQGCLTWYYNDYCQKLWGDMLQIPNKM